MRIEVPQVDFLLDVPNTVTIDKTSQNIIKFGETEKEAQHRIGRKWDECKDQVIFQPAFMGDNLDQSITLAAVEFYSHQAYKKVRSRVAIITGFFRDRFSYNFWIENYEQSPIQKRKTFEYSILQYPQTEDIYVNGISPHLPYWRRRVASYSYFLAGYFAPFTSFILLAYILYVKLIPADSLIGLIIASITILLGVAITGVMALSAWMLIFRNLLPREYLRLLIDPSEKDIIKLEKRLADFYLKPM
jgi:hypothetical protein